MKKFFSLIAASALLVGALTGCVGTPVVYYTECGCDHETHNHTQGTVVETEKETVTVPEVEVTEGALKTGLAIVTSLRDSKDGEKAAYDVTLAAVLVDDEGVIWDCAIDSIGTNVAFDATGAITTDLATTVLTKNELGDKYNMVLYGGAKYEWYVQAEAVAQFAIGKTVEELKNGAVDETGKAPQGSDLATTATIYIGGYVSAIEAAVANATHLGAQGGDELRLASISSLGSSVSATADKAGTAQLDSDVVALTVKDGVITSCYLDSLQAKVNFDATGKITTDLTAAVLTKNQKGADYGMVAWGGAKYEWFEQAASFASYVTGKTAAEVAGIAVNEKTAPTDADLATSVTIAIGGYMALVDKAMK